MNERSTKRSVVFAFGMLIVPLTLEHGSGWTHTAHGQYTHDFTFELNSYKDIDQLTIRFGAHGLFWNAWNYSDLEVRVYLTK